jgi:hypothetical protein
MTTEILDLDHIKAYAAVQSDTNSTDLITIYVNAGFNA